MSWFKIDRKIFENGIWKNPIELRLFIWIIGQAVFDKEIKYGSVTIKRGQYLRSIRKLQEDLVYTENNEVIIPGKGTIERNIKSLERKGMISKAKTELGTLFTVVNYEKYQSNTKIIDENKNELGTGLGTDLGQHGDNTKKDKKEKNIIYISIFDEIRKIYPGIKRGLKTEFNNFKKHQDWGEAISLLKAAIEKEINHRQGLANQGEFCPPWKHFQTWINKRSWEQEFPDHINNKKYKPEPDRPKLNLGNV